MIIIPTSQGWCKDSMKCSVPEALRSVSGIEEACSPCQLPQSDQMLATVSLQRQARCCVGTEMWRTRWACLGVLGISLRFPKHVSSSAMVSFPVRVCFYHTLYSALCITKPFWALVSGPNTVLCNRCSVNGFWINIYLSLIPFLNQYLQKKMFWIFLASSLFFREVLDVLLFSAIMAKVTKIKKVFEIKLFLGICGKISHLFPSKLLQLGGEMAFIFYGIKTIYKTFFLFRFVRRIWPVFKWGRENLKHCFEKHLLCLKSGLKY